MDSAMGHPASPGRGCPIRTSPDHSLLAAPRSFSQPSTSFIGSWCQGIHRAPLLARRLDLSQLPSRQDQRSQKDLILSSLPSLSTALGIGGTERAQYAGYGHTEPVSVCSTTLQFFRCNAFDSTSAFEPSSRSLESAGRGAWTQLRVEPPRPALSRCSSVHTGTKKARRPSSHKWQREVATTGYAVVDFRLRMIPSLLDCLAERQTTFNRAPREYSLYPACSRPRKSFPRGGAEGIRTPDLRRAKAALSQLSYGPARRRVGQPGIEPGTSVLSGLRSSRLSYWPHCADGASVAHTRAPSTRRRPQSFGRTGLLQAGARRPRSLPEHEESGAERCLWVRCARRGGTERGRGVTTWVGSTWEKTLPGGA